MLKLDMDKTHPPELLVYASTLTFALSGRTYERTRELNQKDRARVLRLVRLGFAVQITSDNIFP